MEPGSTETGPTALVVEDEAVLLMLVAETLRDAGYVVYEALDGPAALAHLQARSDIDLMISDIRMPGMTGFEVADAALALRPNLRVVLMTGYTAEAIPKNISNAGVQILHKPFNVDEIPLLANKILNRAGNSI